MEILQLELQLWEKQYFHQIEETKLALPTVLTS